MPLVQKLFAATAGALLIQQQQQQQQTLQVYPSIGQSDVVFTLNDTLYLAATTNPVASFGGVVTTHVAGYVPITLLSIAGCNVNAELISTTVDKYLAVDDVFSEAFLSGTVITSNCTGSVLVDEDVAVYLAGINSTVLAGPSDDVSSSLSTIEPGPYLAAGDNDGHITISKVYRLYRDQYRDFLYGTYPASDTGFYQAFPSILTSFQDPLIPVPSRIYSLSDPRPLAGLRFGVKDLYDLAGMRTSAGSRAWTEITPVSNTTAPAIQQIIDLGGVIVGKQKTAQFASGADLWGWFDVQYPSNPRGDGWLTCSSSSAGAGCSIAAYDWLDLAIGSDTGWSVRSPASVSGTFGNRPSQGMMSLHGVVPLGAAQDTAGSFARDPATWSRFAKQWYVASLYQDPSIHGLEALSVPDSYELPTSIKYDSAYLPVRNPAANELVQQFLANMTTALGMTVHPTNLTSLLLTSPIEAVNNLSYRQNALVTADTYTHWTKVAEPLISAWTQRHDGRFPPVDPAWRSRWVARIFENITRDDYDNALKVKRTFSEWMNNDFLGNNNSAMGSCQDSSLWIYDVGTGGLPSYREENLLVNNPLPTTRLNYIPPDVVMRGVDFCSFAGCADYTVPIGQVEYFSNVSQVTEVLPVTVSLVAKRGCDFVLFNIIERLAELGIIRSVKTGRSAF